MNPIKEIKNDLSVFSKRTRIIKVSLMILLFIVVVITMNINIGIWYISILLGFIYGIGFVRIIRYGSYRAAIKEYFEKGTHIAELMFKYNVSGIKLTKKIKKIKDKQ